MKLRSYISLFKEGRINYQNTDFLVAISYIIKKFKEINRPIILNFTVGTTSGRDISQALLNTFEELYQSGFILVLEIKVIQIYIIREIYQMENL